MLTGECGARLIAGVPERGVVQGNESLTAQWEGRESDIYADRVCCRVCRHSRNQHPCWIECEVLSDTSFVLLTS